jgi:hypothetical protein
MAFRRSGVRIPSGPPNFRVQKPHGLPWPALTLHQLLPILLPIVCKWLTVRDREAPGSNPGPPTSFVFEIGDVSGRLESAEQRRITISCGALKSRRCNGAFREAV